MANPSSRIELKDYCLRKLGFPVIDINVYDGTERVWLATAVSDSDKTNKYLKLADSIIGVSRVFPFIGSTQGSMSTAGFNMFDINYQLRLNDFYNLTSSSYTYYVIAREHLSMLDMIVTGEYPYTYNKKVNRLNVHTDWGKFTTGSYMCFEAHRITDPETYDKVFDDMWLKKYTTELFKQQWGTNMKKYGNYVLPGGLTINSQQIYDEATAQLTMLEQELRDTYEEPTPFLVG